MYDEMPHRETCSENSLHLGFEYICISLTLIQQYNFFRISIYSARFNTICLGWTWTVRSCLTSLPCLLQITICKFNMVGCFPSTPKKLAMTVGFFISAAALFSFGVHLSYANVAPQQARTKARNEFVRERLKQKYGKWWRCHSFVVGSFCHAYEFYPLWSPSLVAMIWLPWCTRRKGAVTNLCIITYIYKFICDSCIILGSLEHTTV